MSRASPLHSRSPYLGKHLLVLVRGPGCGVEGGREEVVVECADGVEDGEAAVGNGLVRGAKNSDSRELDGEQETLQCTRAQKVCQQQARLNVIIGTLPKSAQN